MTTGPFPVASVIARLGTVSTLRLVGASADLDTATQQEPAAVPAAFVLATERGDKPVGASSGVLVQNVQVAISVVLMIRNFRNTNTGSDARAEMDQLQAAVRAALLNWTPGIAYRPLSFQANRDEFYKAGLLVTQEIYRTDYRIEVRT